jgi:23S rRNA (guanosine2251-2'-O)-methyltransferase
MIIYGKQVSIYALRHHKTAIEKILITKKDVLPKELFREFGSKIKFIENRWLQSLTKGGNHQGIAVEISDFETSSLESIKGGDFLLLLDGLTDVGNIGAITRTAYALGVDGVIASNVRSLNFSAITRSSSGALLDMPFAIEPNILDVLNELKMANFSIYGASMDGEPIENCSFEKKRVLVLGSEGRGISKRAKGKIDKSISISMHREFDSLNVSAAASIIIYRMGHGIK